MQDLITQAIERDTRIPAVHEGLYAFITGVQRGCGVWGAVLGRDRHLAGDLGYSGWDEARLSSGGDMGEPTITLIRAGERRRYSMGPERWRRDGQEHDASDAEMSGVMHVLGGLRYARPEAPRELDPVLAAELSGLLDGLTAAHVPAPIPLALLTGAAVAQAIDLRDWREQATCIIQTAGGEVRWRRMPAGWRVVTDGTHEVVEDAEAEALLHQLRVCAPAAAPDLSAPLDAEDARRLVLLDALGRVTPSIPPGETESESHWAPLQEAFTSLLAERLEACRAHICPEYTVDVVLPDGGRGTTRTRHHFIDEPGRRETAVCIVCGARRSTGMGS